MVFRGCSILSILGARDYLKGKRLGIFKRYIDKKELD
jgi:hypothetical protein